MLKAVWNGVVVAASDQTVVLEGNHYFPPDSVTAEYLEPSTLRTVCPWKGVAGYHDVVVDGARNPGAAWFYEDPSPAAADIKGYVAFWRGVKVEA